MRQPPETPDEAQLGLAVLRRQFKWFATLVERADALDVEAGSSLARDRDAARYNPVPHLVQNALAVALDHLHGLQVSVEGSGGALLAMASYTPIRTAYEAAGTGLWLLEPSSRDERLLRSRQLLRADRHQVSVLKTEQGQSDPRFAEMEARLRSQFDARPALAGRSLDKVDSVTARLKAIAVLVPAVKPPPLTLWRMASGIAHGNTFMITAVLEREQIKPSNDGAVDFNITSSYASVAFFYRAALTMVEALLDLYDSRNRPSDGGD